MRKLLLLVLVLALLAGGYVYVALYHPYQGFAAQGVYVDIPRRASQRTIAHLLYANGVIRDPYTFEALCRTRHARGLEAGEYYFNVPVTAFQVFDDLAEGRVYVKEFVVPEGFTMYDIADLAAQSGLITREDFLAAARDPSLIHDLAPAATTLEGFLAPATYEFPRHMAGKEMTSVMVQHFREMWMSLPGKDTLAGRRVLDIVTLASLVERETPRPEERARVAGVFANRLRIGLPLQCDPTVVYALADAGEPVAKLSSADLRFPSPYNTYQNKGLPPGPIANPGAASLAAALQPQQTDDLYFVANTEGGHFFSRTLQEHNVNVARYRHLLEQEQQRGDSAPANAHAIKPSATRLP